MMDSLFQLRKKLGKIRRKLFKTNAAYWYYKVLKKDEYIKRPLIEAKMIFDNSNHSEVVQWILSHRNEYPWIYNAKELKSAFEYSHFYPCLKMDGEIIGFIKVAFEKVYIEDYEREIDLGKEEAFIYDTFVLPEYRRKYLACYLLAELFNDLIRKGTAVVYCHIPRWNVASSRLYLKMGFQRLSYVRYLRFLKYYHFSHKLEDIRKQARKDVEKVLVAL
jgi:ribosomal protein S18 acetylase RimI-like enzyme